MDGKRTSRCVKSLRITRHAQFRYCERFLAHDPKDSVIKLIKDDVAKSGKLFTCKRGQTLLVNGDRAFILDKDMRTVITCYPFDAKRMADRYLGLKYENRNL